MLAILDCRAIDDGTSCEIGVFVALMRSDPEERGIVGPLRDLRGLRGESTGINLFVEGVIEDAGEIVEPSRQSPRGAPALAAAAPAAHSSNQPSRAQGARTPSLRRVVG